MKGEDGIKIDIESPEQFEKDVETIMEEMEEKEKLKEKSEENKDEKVTEEPAEEEVKETAGGSEEEAAKAEDEPVEESEGGEKKKHHGKKDKKEKKDPRDEKIADLEDRVKRQMAEFENFRKRTDKEKSQMFDMGAKSVIEKILPVIDNFERGLENIPEGCDPAFAEGMEKIYKQLTASLEEAGLKHIEAVGQEFDPNLHNAVMHEDNDELGENVVSEEFQKGYMYRDSIVRHSMVKVAN